MTTEEMLEISVNDEMDTFAWSVKNVIELGVKSGIVGRVMPVLYHILGEIEAHTELARWYREHRAEKLDYMEKSYMEYGHILDLFEPKKDDVNVAPYYKEAEKAVDRFNELGTQFFGYPTYGDISSGDFQRLLRDTV